MFQTGFPSIIRTSKLHIQRHAFVRPILLPAASRQASSRWCVIRMQASACIRITHHTTPAKPQYWSDKCVTLYVQFWGPDDGRKPRLKHVQRLTEINKLRKVASYWLYSENRTYSISQRYYTWYRKVKREETDDYTYEYCCPLMWCNVIS